MDVTPQVLFRSADDSDLSRIVELFSLGSLKADKEDPSRLADYVSALAEIQQRPPNDVVVAELDGIVVGAAQLIVFRHLQERGGRCAEIESVHVHPDVRSLGIGGQLIEELVRRAREAGCYRVQLTSNKVRADAHRFYGRLGFEASHEGFKRIL